MKVANKALWAVIFTAVLGILAGAGYLGIVFGFPGLIRSAYQQKNCERATWAADLYTNLGGETSGKGADLVRMVAECNQVAQAEKQAAAQDWQSAYESYKRYTQLFPQGVFAADASDQAAITLSKLAEQQAGQKAFGAAVQSLKTLIADYPSSQAAATSPDTLAQVYLAWGVDQRTAGDFSAAETTLKEMQSWGQQSGQAVYETQARSELANTWLTWGAALEKDTPAEAIAKYEQVVNMDPRIEASANQAGNALVKIYIAKGDALASTEQYEPALAEYENAHKFADSSNEDFVKNARASVYLRWGQSFVAQQDYNSASEKMLLALQNATSDAVRSAITTEANKLYQAFSQSDGDQAQHAMKQAVKDVCEGRKPALPIFGLDETNKKMILSGTTRVSLPVDSIAHRPAELRYVLCITENKKVLQSVTVIAVHGYMKNGYLYSDPGQPATLTNLQWVWDATLVDMATGQVVSTTSFEGAMPPNLPFKNGEVVFFGGASRDGFNIGPNYGDPPSIVNILAWAKKITQ